MNFPVGDVVGKGASPFDLVGEVRKLNSDRFSGYIILSVRGDFVEEGVLFFRDGLIVACSVECLAVQKLIKGVEGLEYFANESRGLGFYQCVSLTKSQVDLVLAFDEKLLAGDVDLKNFPKLIPPTFLRRFSSVAEKKSALDAYGLGDLK